MKKLTSHNTKVSELDQLIIDHMYAIFDRYNVNTKKDLFEKDLFEKDYAILLYDSDDVLQGFTTLAYYPIQHEGKKLNIIYSGDTIIEHDYWGSPELALAWIKIADMLKAQDFHTPLYWFNIVGRHRTYRFLSLYNKVYYPSPKWPTPVSAKILIDKLATAKFGDSYSPEKGTISFQQEREHLKPEWMEIPERLLNKPEIQFFIKHNPGYTRGDYLVCLCELSFDNLNPRIQRSVSKNSPMGYKVA